ncbi:tetratricopeptide repeat protein [Micromonospora sp. NPDC049836]|uniref:tetratricopeptide repeat protein n=1 Tax=Micromonospora sp. NPDC049836 TaxID=3364274 RepID=UPI003789D6CE
MSSGFGELTVQAHHLVSEGDLAGAQRLLADALTDVDPRPANASPELADAAGLQARVLVALGEPHSARGWAAFAYAAATRLYGRSDERAITAAATLAAVLHRVGSDARAARLYSDVIIELTARDGPESQRVLAAHADLATVEYARGQCVLARDRLQDAWELHREVYGDGHPSGIKMLAKLGAMERDCGRYAESHDHLALAEELSTAHLAADDPLAAQVSTLVRTAADPDHVCEPAAAAPVVPAARVPPSAEGPPEPPVYRPPARTAEPADPVGGSHVPTPRVAPEADDDRFGAPDDQDGFGAPADQDPFAGPDDDRFGGPAHQDPFATSDEDRFASSAHGVPDDDRFGGPTHQDPFARPDGDGFGGPADDEWPPDEQPEDTWPVRESALPPTVVGLTDEVPGVRRVPGAAEPESPSRYLPVHVPRQPEPEPVRPGRPWLPLVVVGVVVALLLGVIAVVAGVSRVDRSRDTPAPARTTAAGPSGTAAAPTGTGTPGAAPASPGSPPGAVRLVDRRDSIQLSWTYPAGAEGPVVIAGGRSRDTQRTFQELPAGTDSYVAYGLSRNIDYCFTVAVVWSTDTVARAAPVCTRRG